MAALSSTFMICFTADSKNSVSHGRSTLPHSATNVLYMPRSARRYDRSCESCASFCSPASTTFAASWLRAWKASFYLSACDATAGGGGGRWAQCQVAACPLPKTKKRDIKINFPMLLSVSIRFSIGSAWFSGGGLCGPGARCEAGAGTPATCH